MALPTIEEVKQAYKATMLRPINRTYFECESERPIPTAACALTATCLARGASFAEMIDRFYASQMNEYLAEQLGVGLGEVGEYIGGFDNPTSATWRWRSGTPSEAFRLGVEANRAVMFFPTEE